MRSEFCPQLLILLIGYAVGIISTVVIKFCPGILETAADNLIVKTGFYLGMKINVCVTGNENRSVA